MGGASDNFRYRGVADTHVYREVSENGETAQKPREKNAKAGLMACFHLRLSFVLHISEYYLFFSMAEPRPAQAGRGKLTY